FSKIRNANIFVFGPPAIIELGNSIGFDFQLMDRGGVGHAALTQARNQLLGMAAQDPRLIRVRPNGLEDVPEYRVDVDWEKAGAMGVPITSIHNTISAAFGGAYVNDFIEAGRIKHVWVQLDAPYRMLPKDLEKLYVRNTAGKMVPFSSFASAHWTSGSPRLERYNAFPSMNIWGEPAPGYSSGDAMNAMEELVAKLPQGIGYDWSGLSYQERQGKTVAPYLYTFAIFVVFLYLAGLYASWTIPITIMLVLPLGLIGGTLASSLRGLPSDIYFQIGLLITLGLATKNAILIVQFAKEGVEEEGLGVISAALHAVKLRLRPILMTAMTTGLSVIPLAIATGAGAGAMKAIGTPLLGGMVTGTILVVLFAPLFYVIIEKTFGKRKKSMAV
ncbi:hydrophobe/amphiphile efflux-1 family RND transporter, partial [Candidatus Woesearchaeota archaeon]